jgi:hypothetical protein
MNIRVDDSRMLDRPGGFGPRLQTGIHNYTLHNVFRFSIIVTIIVTLLSLFICPSLSENLTSLNQRYSSFPVTKC